MSNNTTTIYANLRPPRLGSSCPVASACGTEANCMAVASPDRACSSFTTRFATCCRCVGPEDRAPRACIAAARGGERLQVHARGQFIFTIKRLQLVAQLEKLELRLFRRHATGIAACAGAFADTLLSQPATRGTPAHDDVGRADAGPQTQLLLKCAAEPAEQRLICAPHLQVSFLICSLAPQGGQPRLLWAHCCVKTIATATHMHRGCSG